MSGNFFDQFDNKAAPATPPAAAPAGGNFFDQFDAAPAQPAVPTAQGAPSLLMAPVGGAEMLTKLATGAMAAIPAGLAYGGAAVGRALGADVNPSAIQSKVQNYLTYQPLSDSAKAGETALHNLTAPIVDPIANAMDRAATSVGQVSPTAETYLREAPAALQAASGVVPLASGARAVKEAAAINQETKALAATRAPTPEELAVTKAQDLGLKLLPSQQGRTVGAMAEGLTGQAKLERSLSKENAKVVDAAAAEELGLPSGARPTRETLAIKKAQANGVYSEVSKLGPVTTDSAYRKAVDSIDDRSGAGSFAEDTPPAVERLKEIYGSKASFDAADAVAKVRQLRADASKNLKAPNAPEQNALGYAQRKLADALDDQLDRAATQSGNADLVTRYRAARVQLAKIHTVEDAIRGQNISAKALYQQQQRGVPLSGKLKQIADAYGSFDRVLQDVSKLRNTGPLDVVDYLVGAGAAIHNPFLAAAALSRPVIRAGLASDFYQGAKRSLPRSVPPQSTPQVQAMIEAARRRQAAQ